MPKKKVTAAGLAMSATIVAAGGAHDHRMRSRPLCGIPDRAYQSGASSPLVGGLSDTALLVPALPADAPPGGLFKVFTLEQPRLGIDQCVISRVSVTLNRDGEWAVSLLAEQNPRVIEGPSPFVVAPEAIRLAVKQTSQIKRNKFFVRVRCFAATPRLLPGGAAGRPVLLVLEPAPFWVQNGQPRDVLLSGTAPGLPARFGAIDRVEVELAYR